MEGCSAKARQKYNARKEFKRMTVYVKRPDTASAAITPMSSPRIKYKQFISAIPWKPAIRGGKAGTVDMSLSSVQDNGHERNAYIAP